MQKKRQHIIPRGYQSAWCDPNCPSGHEPYIWLISKDGGTRRKRAPAKAFVQTDPYTVRLPNGERELVIENTLARTENDFLRLLKHKIEKAYSLDDQERAALCLFAAGMFARVDAPSEQFAEVLRELREMVAGVERAHDAEPAVSEELRGILENSRPLLVAHSLQDLASLYFAMPMAILIAAGAARFITSDSPTVWYNPQAYKVPPFYRAPGLAQEHIEVTMPLSPRCLMVLSHKRSLIRYRRINDAAVNEINRRTCARCREWFVAWGGRTEPRWFEEGTPPEDRWENTPEGKVAMEERRKREELRALSEEQMAREAVPALNRNSDHE